MTDHRIFSPRFDGNRVIEERALIADVRNEPVRLWRGLRGEPMTNVTQRWVVHSPDGFEWGYWGSGPADLALNILGEFVAPPEAWRLHHSFKMDFLGKLSREGPHEIKAERIVAWLKSQWEVTTNKRRDRV